MRKRKAALRCLHLHTLQAGKERSVRVEARAHCALTQLGNQPLPLLTQRSAAGPGALSMDPDSRHQGRSSLASSMQTNCHNTPARPAAPAPAASQ